MPLDIDADLAFRAQSADGLDFEVFADRVGTGFNEYGVRENTDADGNITSIDVLYEAMEPGPPERRNGVRITPEFLRRVGEKDYDPLPFMKDHERASSQKIGDVRRAFYSEHVSKLMLMNRIPNTGAPAHDEAIARYTHDPPSWRDGSVGFGRDYEAVENDAGEPELRDATLREFSATPFPGGYDDGGLKAAFADKAQAAVSVNDSGSSDENPAAFITTTQTITF
jgi:hypothetical protein